LSSVIRHPSSVSGQSKIENPKSKIARRPSSVKTDLDRAMLQPSTIVYQRYHVVQQVGRGGMGAVYEAVDTRLGNAVALKQMLVNGSHAEQAFQREAQLLAQLRHPALPKVIDFFSEPAGQFLVMEYIPGPTLAELLSDRGASFSADHVVCWAEQILETLDYLHRRQPPIIHRDIKPQNLKLTPEGRVVLLDFGLAKSIAGGQTAVMSSLRGYTPQYAALEQIQGARTDLRSDLYSVAATMYCLLANRPPVDALARTSALIAQQPDPLIPLRTLNPQISPALEAAVGQALALNPDARPADAGALRAILHAAKQLPTAATVALPPQTSAPSSDGHTVVASPIAAPTLVETQSPEPHPTAARQTQPLGRNRLPLMIGGVLAAVALFAVVSALTAPRPTAERNPPADDVSLAGAPVPAHPTLITPGSAARITQLARWGRGKLNALALAPDGQTLALATDIGIYVYDAISRQETRFIPTDARVWSVAFTPDGQTLASGGSDDLVRLWRVANGELIRTLEGHTNQVKHVAFSPDGQILASGSFDETVRLWRANDGALIRTLRDFGDNVNRLAFTPDGAILTVGSDAGVDLRRVATGERLDSLEEHDGDALGVAFSADGALIASSSNDDKVRLWNFDGEQTTFLHTLEGHESWIDVVAFSPNGQIVASGSNDNTVRLWNVADGSLLRSFEGHTSSVEDVMFAPDGSTLWTVSGGDLRIWNINDGQLVQSIATFSDSVNDVAFTPAGDLVAVGSDDRSIRLLRAADGVEARVWTEQTDQIEAVDFSPDGALLASASWDGSASVWNVSDGSRVHTFDHAGSLADVAFSPDSTFVATAMRLGGLTFWRISDGARLNVIEDVNDVEQIAFAPDSATLASCSEDGTVRLRRVDTGEQTRVFEGPDYVNSIAFSPDGAVLAAAYEDDTIRLWNVRDGALLRTLQGHTDLVATVAFTPDGQMLVSGSRDRTVRLWRVSDGALLNTLVGHGTYVKQVDVSPDGRTIVSGSIDGTVRVWGIP
jgi:WD40 repeat protein/serine/threonine protein kinase